VRKEAKNYDISKLIEAPFNTSRDVIIIEDVVTDGSSLNTVNTLREAGFNIIYVFAIIDRLECGRTAIIADNIYFKLLFTRHDFIVDPTS
jgi:orotate phosphoribosyltransferase